MKKINQNSAPQSVSSHPFNLAGANHDRIRAQSKRQSDQNHCVALTQLWLDFALKITPIVCYALLAALALWLDYPAMVALQVARLVTK